jgi:hypothetical protein
MEYQGEITGTASWPPIVREETWRAVTAILTDPGRTVSPGPAPKHLLSFIARCSVCEGPVIVGKNNHQAVYQCRTAAKGHVNRNQRSVDDFVTRLVIGRLSRADAIALLRPDVGPQRDALYREQIELEQAMREENDLRKRKLLTAAEFAESRAEHLEGLERVKDSLAALLHSDILAPLIVRFAAEAPDYEGRVAIWDDYPLGRRRGVIDTLMTIRILQTRQGRPPGWRRGESYFDPASVEITWRGASS